MARLVHAQTILEEDKLILLKSLTKEEFTKDALGKAVDFYITMNNGG